MKLAGESVWKIRHWAVLTMIFAMIACESGNLPDPSPGNSNHVLEFPSFITPVELYFKENISDIPDIDQDVYRLKISGAIDNPTTFTLEELAELDMTKRTLTIECIGNPANGPLLGTATWKGFNMYQLLSGLGIKEEATVVKYRCADGYFSYNTLAELQNADIMGALYMNDEPIPDSYGFPLRIIFPGYFGVRQPGWVVEIELLEILEEDYWQLSGWKTDTSMSIDSKIFFPSNHATFTLGDSIKIGGAAFGSKRISAVDITLDDGLSWTPARIVEKLDEDYTWVFWELNVKPPSAGKLTIRSRASGVDGSVQPKDDYNYLDGFNAWPVINIQVD